MAIPSNILQQVQTYQMSGLAFLLNNSPFIGTTNKKFKNFNTLTANRGDTVTFDLTPRMVAQDGLVAGSQPAVQRVENLVCDKAKNIPFDFTNQQFIFNAREYMDRFGEAAIHALGGEIEKDVATSCETQPYRFYGDGITQLSSVNQLADMLAKFRNYGAPRSSVKAYLQDTAVPGIASTMLNQFVPSRNEETANSWMVGNWRGVDWYESDLLPKHFAGTVGNDQAILTVVSTDDPTGNNITSITFSGAGTDANAIKANDNLGCTSGQTFLTFITYADSVNPIQIKATADAASSGGNVTVQITPALCATPGNSNRNIRDNITAGMTFKVLPDHRCGVIVGGDAFYLAMPQLPDQRPFDTANKVDEATGASIRLTYGAVLGQNDIRMIYDAIYGYKLVPEYSMKIVFPA